MSDDRSNVVSMPRPLSEILADEERTVSNFYEVVNDRGKVTKKAFRDIPEIWRKIQAVTDGKLHRVGTTPFFVQPTGEVLRFRQASALFAFLYGRGAIVNWSDSTPGAISKTEMHAYCGQLAKQYELITSLPHYPKLPECFYAVDIEPEQNGSLDTLINMLHFATDADRQLLKALFMTPFWGGGGGQRPSFIIDGLENDAEENRGIGKTTITKFLATLCGEAVDVSSKTDGEDVKKRILTSHDSRLVRMDNIKAGTLSSEVLESLITADRISGHKMYEGHGSMPNWFTYVLTFNGAVLSRDMSQRSMIIRLKRPEKYNPAWESSVTAYIQENRYRLIADIGYELMRDMPTSTAQTRFARWECAVLAKASSDMPTVLAAIAKEQRETNSDNQLADSIREIMVSNISKFYRPDNVDGRPIYFNPDTDAVAIKRSEIFKWITPLFQKGITPKMIGKRFEAAKISEFYFETKMYLGDHYLIWRGGVPNRTDLPASVWRVDHQANNKIAVTVWKLRSTDAFGGNVVHQGSSDTIT